MTLSEFMRRKYNHLIKRYNAHTFIVIKKFFHINYHSSKIYQVKIVGMAAVIN